MYCWRGLTWLIFIHYGFIQRYDCSYVITFHIFVCDFVYKLLFVCCLLFPPSHLLSIKVIILTGVACRRHHMLIIKYWVYCMWANSIFHWYRVSYSGCYGERHIPRAEAGCSKHRETNCTQHVVLKRHWGIASSAVLTQTTDSKLAVGKLVGHFVRMAQEK